MIVASGPSATALIGELSVALVVAIIGSLIAYLLGKNGAAQQSASMTVIKTLDSQTDKLDSHGKSLTSLQTSLAPAVVELELHQIAISALDRDVAVLKEWRAAHDTWSKETIDRLERGIRSSRSTDGP